MSLDNNRFIKYKQILTNNCNQQGIKGHHLSQMNELDIQGIGITKFEDKKYLIKQINHLIQQNKIPLNHQNEGIPNNQI